MAKSYAMMVVYFTYSLIRQMDGATSFNYSAFLSYLCTFICQRAIHSDNSNPTLRSKLGYSFLTSLEISNKLKIKMNSYWNKMIKFLGVFPTHLKVWLICVHVFIYVQRCMGWFEIHVGLSQYRFSYYQFV